MRALWLLSGALGGAVGLWFLVKLDATYAVTYHVALSPRPLEDLPEYVEVEAKGSGYELLLARRYDTISPIRLCVAPPERVGPLLLRWNLAEFHRRMPCHRLKQLTYRPLIRWIHPEGMDFVGPVVWARDTVWVWERDTLPPWEYTCVAREGRHRYPIPLPPQWGVYPETLWVEAEVAPFVFATVTITPHLEGAENTPTTLTPDRVEVRFWLPRPYLRKWKPEDFEVVVNMRKVLPNDSFVYPELRRYPPFIYQVEMVPSKLSFTRLP
ncbi:MAG: hypothetical protein NZ958_06770 [Bacteroidia bacterium]|nr:hypothetical protein [Bacteroidia bacterium]MDW8089413.1 hypothetical protein [Bacteroidia bacterium]